MHSGEKMKVLRDEFIFNGFQLTSWSLNRHGNTFKLLNVYEQKNTAQNTKNASQLQISKENV